MTKERICAKGSAMSRRNLLAALPFAGTATIATAATQEDNDNLELLCEISRNTGLSLDNVYDWTKGLPRQVVEIMAHNTRSTPVGYVGQINYHARRAQKLLAKTVPDGHEFQGSFFAIGRRVEGMAFPPNWQPGQPHMQFQSDAGWQSV